MKCFIFLVPVNFLRAKDEKQRFFKEKISYEHQYNSRNKPNYPIRGKVCHIKKKMFMYAHRMWIYGQEYKHIYTMFLLEMNCSLN